MRRLTQLSLLPALLIALTSCAGGSLRPDTTSVQAAKIATQYGVMRYIGSVPEADRAAKAERIRVIVTEVEGLVKGEAVSLTLLEEAIRKHLPADMKPEDVFAVNSLLGLVMSELRARVGDGVLSPEQILQVSAVAGWVIDATRYYSA